MATNGNGFATAIALDSAGNAFVGGNENGDYVIAKYSPNGNVLWTARLAGKPSFSGTIPRAGWTQTTANPAPVAARSGQNVSNVNFGVASVN